jgi:membrane-associated protein
MSHLVGLERTRRGDAFPIRCSVMHGPGGVDRLVFGDRTEVAQDLIELGAGAGSPGLVALTLCIAFAESAILLDLVVPGEVGLVLAGAVAAELGTPLPLVIGVAAAGAVLGDALGYLLGRRLGPEAARRWSWSRRILQPRLDRAKEHFERRGGMSVAAARWVGALRAVVPVMAGAAAFPFRRFLLWDVPAAMAWSATVVTAGFLVGDDIAQLVDRIGTGISVVAVGGILGVVAWRHHQARGEPTLADR